MLVPLESALEFIDNMKARLQEDQEKKEKEEKGEKNYSPVHSPGGSRVEASTGEKRLSAYDLQLTKILGLRFTPDREVPFAIAVLAVLRQSVIENGNVPKAEKMVRLRELEKVERDQATAKMAGSSGDRSFRSMSMMEDKFDRRLK